MRAAITRHSRPNAIAENKAESEAESEQREVDFHALVLSIHMAFDMVDPLTVLRPMSVLGKTWALAWIRIVGRALPRRRENRVPH
jgi:hypothetical protein